MRNIKGGREGMKKKIQEGCPNIINFLCLLVRNGVTGVSVGVVLTRYIHQPPAHTRTHTHTHTHARKHAHARARALTHTRAHARTHIDTHSHIHARTHTHTHTVLWEGKTTPVVIAWPHKPISRSHRKPNSSV